MSEHKIKRALISVYDKTGIADFARALVEEFGIEIISTGGTAKLLKESGIPVTLVEDITGWGEMLDGRVKTLHPKIHAAILADRDNPRHMQQLAEAGIEPIDMVVVNLYPFEKTVADPNCKFEDAIEMIDIGGPCLLRAAAKNHRHVWVVRPPGDVNCVLDVLRCKGSEDPEEVRLRLATKVFGLTTVYENCIRDYLMWKSFVLDDSPFDPFTEVERIQVLHKHTQTRYGENPHQRGAVFRNEDIGWRNFRLWGSSSNYSTCNFMDISAALDACTEIVRELKLPTSVFIKHTNACGVGIAEDPLDAYRRAYHGDPIAAMGGVVACSHPVTLSIASAIMNSLDRWGRNSGAAAFFVEVIVAPSFDDDAVKFIQGAKSWGRRVRLLPVGDFTIPPNASALETRSLFDGILIQTPDTIGLNEDQWKVVTDRQPTEQELNDLRLAWLIAKHTKSNAISICKDGMLIGNGAGQMSRVMSCRIATWLANENGHGEKLKGAAAASDAFFPFRDGPDILIDAGVTAIIQPGGSKRDADTIAACNQRGVAMIFTGTRHFRH